MRRAVLILCLLAVPARAEDTTVTTTRWIGTWSGKVTAKGCVDKPKKKVALAVAFTSKNGLRSNGDLFIEGLGDLDWTADGDNLVYTREGLSAKLETAAKGGAKLSLTTDGGCTIKATLKRTSSGMPECDHVRALATVKAQCISLSSDTRGATLSEIEGDWKSWSRLRGKKKKAQAAACKDQTAMLEFETQPCLGGTTGIAVCDDYARVVQTYAQCTYLPQDERDYARKAYEQFVQGLGTIDDSNRYLLEESCAIAADSLRQNGWAYGCTM
jgi:hypothetical protein